MFKGNSLQCLKATTEQTIPHARRVSVEQGEKRRSEEGLAVERHLKCEFERKNRASFASPDASNSRRLEIYERTYLKP